jgi:hypothetical protein
MVGGLLFAGVFVVVAVVVLFVLFFARVLLCFTG